MDTIHAPPHGKGSWRFDFHEPFEVREGQVVKVSDVVFRHCFPTIGENQRNVYMLQKWRQFNLNLNGLSLSLDGGTWTATLASTSTDGEYVASLDDGSSTWTETWRTSGVSVVGFTLTRVATTWGTIVGTYDISTSKYEYSTYSWSATANAPSTPTSTFYTASRKMQLDVGMYNDAAAVATEITTKFNTGTRWGGSTSTLTSSFPGNDSVIVLAANGTDATRAEEKFYVIDEGYLRSPYGLQEWTNHGGEPYDRYNPKSCNPLLGNMKAPEVGGRPSTAPQTTQTLGQCDAEFHVQSIYLHCQQLSGLNVRGPALGSSSCLGVLQVQGNYGDIISSNIAPESMVVNAPPVVQSYMTFSLRDCNNHELDMKGSRLSLVLTIKKDIQAMI